MSWQHLGRLGGNNIPASRNHGDVMRPPTQAELAAYVGWVGFINPAPSQSPVASPADGTWRSWVDGANPAYGPFASRSPPARQSTGPRGQEVALHIMQAGACPALRSEERRVGTEYVCPCSYRCFS